ncbi:MAG: hypothetical protein H6721_02780 [Sandaracinus sp.]|nr:hypothetical protein [Sandaracinus sp.]MCB9631059.1 hypothetical protein [Sandaracinus sp.]
MKRSFAVILLVVSFAMPTSRASAGAWVPAPGHGYAKLWAKYLWGWGFVDGAGDMRGYESYHELFFATYGDVGVAPRLAVFWHSDLLRTYHLGDARDGSVERHVAPGDPQVGLRLSLLQRDRLALAVEGAVRAPFARGGPQQTVYASKDPNEPIGELRVGSGVWEVEGRVAFGYAFDHVYLAFATGYQWRGEGFDDRLLWSAEVGWSFTDAWASRVRASGAHSFRFESQPRASSPSGAGNGSSWAGLAWELERKIVDRWYASFVLEGGLFGLRRLSGGPVLSLGVATQF